MCQTLMRHAPWYSLGNVAPGVMVTIPRQYYITEARIATYGEFSGENDERMGPVSF